MFKKKGSTENKFKCVHAVERFNEDDTVASVEPVGPHETHLFTTTTIKRGDIFSKNGVNTL